MLAVRMRAAEEFDNARTVSVSHTHPSVIKPSNFIAQCSVVAGKLSPVSLLNVDVVVRPSTVERIVKVPPGARGTGSGAVPRTLKTMVITITTTENEELVLGRLGMAEPLR